MVGRWWERERAGAAMGPRHGLAKDPGEVGWVLLD